MGATARWSCDDSPGMRACNQTKVWWSRRRKGEITEHTTPQSQALIHKFIMKANAGIPTASPQPPQDREEASPGAIRSRELARSGSRDPLHSERYRPGDERPAEGRFQEFLQYDRPDPDARCCEEGRTTAGPAVLELVPCPCAADCTGRQQDFVSDGRQVRKSFDALHVLSVDRTG